MALYEVTDVSRWLALNRDTVHSSDMSVPTYQTMWYHNSEQHNLVPPHRIFIHANCT